MQLLDAVVTETEGSDQLWPKLLQTRVMFAFSQVTTLELKNLVSLPLFLPNLRIPGDHYLAKNSLLLRRSLFRKNPYMRSSFSLSTRFDSGVVNHMWQWTFWMIC